MGLEGKGERRENEKEGGRGEGKGKGKGILEEGKEREDERAVRGERGDRPIGKENGKKETRRS